MADDLQILDRFPNLLDRCRATRFEVNADSGLFTIDEKHAEQVRRLLGDVVTFLGEIESRYSSARGSDGEQVSLVARSIADLSFLGKLELDGIASQFAEARGNEKVWEVLRYSDMGGARAEQALLALESSIREAEGLSARDHDDLDLGPALEVRKQYALLRFEMRSAGEPEGELLQEALDALLAKITHFRDHETYAQVRVDDRLQIRGLQKRVRAAVSGESVESPARLWEDIEAAMDLLLHINRRSVLQDHDCRLLEALGPQVDSTRYLNSLLGRDAGLDAILLGGREAEEGELEALLDDLRSQMLD